jgi:hypothetical protein
LRAEGFSCSLDVLYGGLGISTVNCNFDLKKKENISAVFFQFLVIETLDQYPDPDSLEMLDPVRIRIHNTALKSGDQPGR